MVKKYVEANGIVSVVFGLLIATVTLLALVSAFVDVVTLYSIAGGN